MTHPVFELITPPGGPRAHMSGFTNDLTNFQGFPALGAKIPIFWAGSPVTFKIKSYFMIVEPDWVFNFRECQKILYRMFHLFVYLGIQMIQDTQQPKDKS